MEKYIKYELRYEAIDPPFKPPPPCDHHRSRNLSFSQVRDFLLLVINIHFQKRCYTGSLYLIYKTYALDVIIFSRNEKKIPCLIQVYNTQIIGTFYHCQKNYFIIIKVICRFYLLHLASCQQGRGSFGNRGLFIFKNAKCLVRHVIEIPVIRL